MCPPLERIVIYPATSEREAFETEVIFIWYYGRKDIGTGCLRNLTDGGEGGIQGIKPSEETRQKMREARIGKRLSPKTCLRISRAVTGKKRSQETIMRMRESHKGTGLGNRNAAGPQTLEARRRRSDSLKGKPWTAARRAAEELRRLRICQ